MIESAASGSILFQQFTKYNKLIDLYSKCYHFHAGLKWTNYAAANVVLVLFFLSSIFFTYLFVNHLQRSRIASVAFS